MKDNRGCVRRHRRTGQARIVHGARAGLAALLLGAATGSVAARPPSLEEMRASTDVALLLEWGKRHFYGVMAPQSVDRAIQFYCRAAHLGSGEAQYRLGEIYARTLNGKTDEVLAASWLLKASLSHYDAAKELLAQWDLTQATFSPEPECVLSEAMVNRSLSPARSRVVSVSEPETQTPPLALGSALGRAEIERLVRALAPSYRISPELVLAVVQVESNFDPKAQSPKHAQGLMQLIPETAKRFGVQDPWDPSQNLRGGMAYLRWLLDHFDGDLQLALAGYNAGEQAVLRYGGVPPYTETRNYLRRVARVLGVSEDELSGVNLEPVSAAPASKPATQSDFERRFFAVGAPG